jgi:hypothetical protein
LFGKSLGIGLGGLHALGQIANLFLAGNLILTEVFELGVLVINEKCGCSSVENCRYDKNPFPDVALGLRMVNDRLLAFGHSLGLQLKLRLTVELIVCEMQVAVNCLSGSLWT